LALIAYEAQHGAFADLGLQALQLLFKAIPLPDDVRNHLRMKLCCEDLLVPHCLYLKPELVVLPPQIV
jgi:hypothetical protein